MKLLIFLVLIGIFANISGQSLKEHAFNRKILEDFTGDLYKNISSKIKQDFSISPLSLRHVLAMALQGAKAGTATQISNYLRLPKNKKFRLSPVLNVLKDFEKFDDAQLFFASALYVSMHAKLKPAFEKDLVNSFHARLEHVHFKAKRTIKIINYVIKTRTENLIKDLVDPKDFDDNSTFSLANAFYFKGQWKGRFKALRKRESFSANFGSPVKVKVMQSTQPLKVFKSKEFKTTFVQIPYSGKRFFLNIAMPKDKRAMKHLEQNLDKVLSLRLRTRPKKTRIIIPKFSAVSSLNLKKLLETSGLKKVFTKRANFKRISDGPPLHLGNIVQKTGISFDEGGTEAAGASETDVNFRIGRGLEILKVNKPFVYWITTYDYPILIGRVTKIPK